MCIRDRDIHLTVRDSVKKLIMEKGTDKKYGARPLRRAAVSYTHLADVGQLNTRIAAFIEML